MRSFKSLDDTITKMKDRPHIPWVCLRKKKATVHFLREIVTRELTVIIDAAENDNVASYCTCDQQEFGQMIQCDNDECSFQRQVKII
ncbi:hypothetical protein ACJMK2_012335 [Sinanodonta woodiana]|uniref:Uncharacterized protein n=1 Tax=Sinanodonta woodiana TaxID=1069815 RepID=A0ABD3VA56_SINWO